MTNAAFVLLGIVFGVTLYKAEIISWYRIQEMFRFHSFHMYGVLGTAVVTAMLAMILLTRRLGVAPPRRPFHHGVWIGGLMFGMGWALTGACPGPLWVHVGAGTSAMLVAIFAALVGVWVYALVERWLPH
ncbi:MAG TPA: DUF6691 family protein [Candidatus Krumholzibacteria bacterium]|nr:DUF6691 family protein [Candidatus Krumholzibacteria bacterium]